MLYVWDVCAGESSPPPSPPSCQYLSASASTGGRHEGTQKQTMREDCNFCATALFILFFDKIIACSDADAHTFASLCCSLYTLCLFKLTVATGRT